ncbi:hypothetical protein VE03_01359 [Pseudogymnoascus sp. 23342-1-I1]|nr:hypothetical protein VE03_01359 [Pseudogymnoascus sp. 23342-1-I1]
MRFTTFLIASVFTALAAAQSAANPFTNSDYSAISASQPFTITWSPTTTGPISLVLVKGNPAALTTVSTIASGLDNTGSFSWTPSSSLAKGTDYALKIVSDADATIVNYTLQFPIDSSGTGTVSSAVSSAVASTTAASTSAPDTTTIIPEASTETTAPAITTSAAADASTAADSTTLATVTTPDASSSAFSASDKSATTSPSATTSKTSKSSTVSESSSKGAAAATGAANACAGLMGVVGAAVLLL